MLIFMRLLIIYMGWSWWLILLVVFQSWSFIASNIISWSIFIFEIIVMSQMEDIVTIYSLVRCNMVGVIVSVIVICLLLMVLGGEAKNFLELISEVIIVMMFTFERIVLQVVKFFVKFMIYVIVPIPSIKKPIMVMIIPMVIIMIVISIIIKIISMIVWIVVIIIPSRPDIIIIMTRAPHSVIFSWCVFCFNIVDVPLWLVEVRVCQLGLFIFESFLNSWLILIKLFWMIQFMNILC